MKFIINKLIKFHEDRSTLEAVDDNIEPVVLTATLNRLLSLLVKNNNALLSRDYILTQVWELHGQTASSNNLNNYMSMLRKMLASLGVDDIIITMPRQGFMFAASEINTIDDEIIINENSELQVATAASKRKLSLKLQLLLAICVAAAIVTSAFACLSPDYEPVSYKTIGKVENCAVKLVTTFHYVEHVDVNIQGVGKQLTALGLDCSKPASVYYYSSQAPLGKIGRNDAIYFISYCPQSDNAVSAMKCENIYENNHL